MEKFLILFHFHFFCSLVKELNKFQVTEILQYILIKKDIVSHLNMFRGKMSDFVSFPLFGFTLVIKLRILIFVDTKLMLDLIMSCHAMSDLV